MSSSKVSEEAYVNTGHYFIQWTSIFSRKPYPFILSKEREHILSFFLLSSQQPWKLGEAKSSWWPKVSQGTSRISEALNLDLYVLGGQRCNHYITLALLKGRHIPGVIYISLGHGPRSLLWRLLQLFIYFIQSNPVCESCNYYLNHGIYCVSFNIATCGHHPS